MQTVLADSQLEIESRHEDGQLTWSKHQYQTQNPGETHQKEVIGQPQIAVCEKVGAMVNVTVPVVKNFLIELEETFEPEL